MKSLRQCPEGIVAFLEIKEGDKLQWKMDVKDNERMAIVKKVLKTRVTKTETKEKWRITMSEKEDLMKDGIMTNKAKKLIQLALQDENESVKMFSLLKEDLAERVQIYHH